MLGTWETPAVHDSAPADKKMFVDRGGGAGGWGTEPPTFKSGG